MFERREYSPWMAYGQFEDANILFALALDERARADGVCAFFCIRARPSHLYRSISPEMHFARRPLSTEGGDPIIDLLKTVEQGAATSVWCATSPQFEGTGGVQRQNSDIALLVTGELA